MISSDRELSVNNCMDKISLSVVVKTWCFSETLLDRASKIGMPGKHSPSGPVIIIIIIILIILRRR